MQEDITDPIVIIADNITLDLCGKTIKNFDDTTGISFSGFRSNIIIKNGKIINETSGDNGIVVGATGGSNILI